MDTTRVATERKALELAHESAAARLGGMTFQVFAEAVRDFDIHPVHARGVLCGAVLVRGAEIHACVLPSARGRWFGKKEAALLDGVIKKHGAATTSATTAEGRRFVERLGFIESNGIYRRSTRWASNRF